MKGFLNQSFFRKLLFGFLITGITPLLVCAVFMTGILEATLENDASISAQSSFLGIESDIDGLFSSCESVLDRLCGNEQVKSALCDETVSPRKMYFALYDATRVLKNEVDFSIFTAAGDRVYTTAGGLRFKSSPDWGSLKAAGQSEGVIYLRSGYQDIRTGAACAELAQAIRQNNRIIGYAVASIRPAAFDRLLLEKHGDAGETAIVDRFWHGVYATRSSISDEILPQFREQLIAQKGINSIQGEFYYHIKQNPRSGFYFILQRPKPIAGKTMSLVYLTTASMTFLCLLLCLGFAFIMSRQFFEPVRALNDAMISVEKGNLSVRIENDRIDELGQLAGRFNSMVKKLRQNMEESLSRQKELNNTRIRMMQAQLNPHFLYNTLDTVKWIAKINRLPEVATISSDLADILRSSISGEEFVSLDYELELLERYVEIQKIRFPNKFEFKIDAEPEARQSEVPKLMLQPLVENAIIHGFEDGSSGNITVSAKRVGGELIVDVRDDGCGISDEVIDMLKTHTAPEKGHLGLHNVDAILRLHYGEERALRFVSTGGHGTCIRIALPFEERGQRGC